MYVLQSSKVLEYKFMARHGLQVNYESFILKFRNSPNTVHGNRRYDYEHIIFKFNIKLDRV